MASDAKPSAPGYRLFWVHQRQLGWLDLPVGGAYAVLGRHSKCDTVLGGDLTVSLRHVLATTVELADGVALRFLDLQTAMAFHTTDGLPRRSVVAFGSVAIGLGDYVVGGIPIEDGPAGPQLSLEPLSQALVTEAEDLSGSPPERPRGERITRITSIPPPCSIADLRRDDTGPLRARLTLRRGALGASVGLKSAQLDRGVLIGRADRCLDGGLRAVLDDNISRVHLLLLHHYGKLEAFDICSTQGTFNQGERWRRGRIQAPGSHLVLGSVDPVTMLLETVGEAEAVASA